MKAAVLIAVPYYTKNKRSDKLATVVVEFQDDEVPLPPGSFIVIRHFAVDFGDKASKQLVDNLIKAGKDTV